MGTPKTAMAGKVEINSGAQGDVTAWSLEETADNKTFVSSSTGGWAQTAEGAKRWTGTLTILLDAAAFLAAPLVPGTLLTKLDLFTDASNHRYGQARVDSVSGPEVDIDGSGMIAQTVNVTGHGPLT